MTILQQNILNTNNKFDESISKYRTSILKEPDWSRGYNLSKPLEEVLKEQAQSVWDLAIEMDTEFFKGRLRNGFFIEAGAYNGKCY